MRLVDEIHAGLRDYVRSVKLNFVAGEGESYIWDHFWALQAVPCDMTACSDAHLSNEHTKIIPSIREMLKCAVLDEVQILT